MNEPTTPHGHSASASAGASASATPAGARRFRPRWWAAVAALSFSLLTIYLGNWQGGKADYKISQQAQLDDARAAPAIDVLMASHRPADVLPLRYRAVRASGRFDGNHLLFVDNRIQDGKAGYGVVQLFLAERDGVKKYLIVDRGWLPAALDRATLPNVTTPSEAADIVGRINVAPSRNPGTADNDRANKRINYLNLDELSARIGVPLEPYVFEQTAGAGFLGTQRAAPGLNYEKNRAYQVQWYAFAALAIVLFFVLSFRKVSAP
jgi:surfeit locus 1 family protein